MTVPTTHRVWKIGTITLLLAISLQLTLQGFFKPRAMLTEHSELQPQHGQSGRKVIYMLFDALREDFVQFPSDQELNLDSEAQYAYTGKKVALFNEMVESKPENAMLFPLKSEMPTVTVVRIKGILSGILNTVFEFTESIAAGKFSEDNLLYQLHAKLGNKARVVFYGDDIWTNQFGKWWTRYADWSSLDINDLDTLDQNVSSHVIQELEKGSDFDFMLVHMIGVDSAGHTFGSKHPNIERKLGETEKFIRQVIDLMDDETTLVVYGDHGMTEEGSHGGNSELEMRTALFAYQKKPFPFAKKYREVHHHFGLIDNVIKQVDLAVIGAELTNVPIPFSNLGIIHPVFVQADNLQDVVKAMRKNIAQVDTYLTAYCKDTSQHWCDNELKSFESEMRQFDQAPAATSDKELIKQIAWMNTFMNDKYEHFKSVWIEFDPLSMQLGIGLALHLFFFHQYVSFSRSQHYQELGGLVGLSVSTTTYLGSLLGMYSLWIPAIVSFIISTGQSWRQRKDYVRFVYSQLKKGNFTPKGVVYPSLISIIVISYIVVNASDLMIQEQDYVYDSLLLVCLFMMWVTQPAYLRKRDFASIIVIVACLKVLYLCDNEHGLNRLVEPELAELKNQFQDVAQYAQFIPLLACVFLENKIARHYSFGLFYKLLAHGLTAMIAIYTGVIVRNKVMQPEAGTVLDQEQKALKDERDQMAAAIGNLTYLAVLGSIVACTIMVKFVEDRTWDNVSVRCGLLLSKAAMLVAGRLGPLVYFCMILQIYNFSLIINKRRDSQPGVTFPIQIFFAYFTMHVYFLRTGHRERMSTIQVGKVCPGGVYCPESVHHALLVFDLLAPYIIGHLCLPLVVKARVQHAYAHLLPPEQAQDAAGGQTTELATAGRNKKGSKKVNQSSGAKEEAKEDSLAKSAADSSSSQPQKQFIGSMEQGMAIVMAMTIIQVIVSSAFVFWAREELIFPDRVAPKFIFDICRAAISLGFAAFWM